MAYDLKSFRAWATYYDVAMELPEREQGVFYRAIFEYMFTGNDMEDSLPKLARICFKSIKPNLKRSKSKARKDDETCADDAVDALSTSHENGTKNALNSKLKLNSNSKGTDAECGGGKTTASARAERLATPPCPNPQCNGHLYRNTQTGVMVCDTCSEVAS